MKNKRPQRENEASGPDTLQFLKHETKKCKAVLWFNAFILNMYPTHAWSGLPSFIISYFQKPSQIFSDFGLNISLLHLTEISHVFVAVNPCALERSGVIRLWSICSHIQLVLLGRVFVDRRPVHSPRGVSLVYGHQLSDTGLRFLLHNSCETQ